MKKILTVILVSLLLPTMVYASLTPVSLIRDTVLKFIKPGIATDGLLWPGLATSTTGCLSVATGGWISASGSACGSGISFSPDTNYGVQVYSTSTPTLWFKNGLYASSTSIFTAASTTNIGSTGSAYFATLGGNVGIGTTTPSDKLTINGNGRIENQGQLKFSELRANGNNVITLSATSSLANDTNYTIDGDGSNGQVLTTNGVGNLHFTTPSFGSASTTLLADTNTWTGKQTFNQASTTQLTVTGTGTSTVFMGNVKIEGNLEVVGETMGAGMIALITAMIAAALVTFGSAVVTLTNKRITQRVITTTDDSTSAINVDVTDVYELSAVANATEFTLTGTPTSGQKLIVKFKDAGVAKALTWTGFTAIGVTAPTTTVAGKQHYVGCFYNGAATRWEIIAAVVED